MNTATAAQPRIRVVTREVRLVPAPNDDGLDIDSGDLVTIRTPQGGERSGRARLVYDTYAMLDGGGAHGTPLAATADNLVRIGKKR